MNLMSKWVKMVNEGTYNFPEENDDVSRTERGELGADNYEKQQSLLADIEKANEKYEKTKIVKEEEENEENVPELTDDEKKNLEVPKNGDYEKQYWDRVQKQIEKIKDGAVRLMVVKLAREIFDRAEKHPNMDFDDRELENKMKKIVDDINNGDDSEESIEKSMKEFEDILNYKFTSDIQKGGIDSEKTTGTEGIEDDPEYIALHDELEKLRKKGKDTKSVQAKIKDMINKRTGQSSEDDKEKFYIVNEVVNVVRKDNENYIQEVDIHRDMKFKTEEDAAKFVSKELTLLKQKYHIEPDQYLNLKDTYETAKKSSDVYKNSKSAIPTNINRVDPNAYGWIYPNPQNHPEDGNRKFHIEYIIYRASNVAPYPSQEEENKEREQRMKDYYEYIQNLDKEISATEREHFAKEIENALVKMYNNDEEDKILKIFKEFIPKYLKNDDKFSKMKDEDILNITADDIIEDEKFTLNKIKVLASKLDYELKKKIQQDDFDDEEETGEFDPNAKDTKLATDDEILKAAEQEKELEKMKKDMEKQGSIDGYSTRGDETKSDKEAREDAEAREREEERNRENDDEADKIEGDADDYEGGQEGAGIGGRTFSSLKGQSSTGEKSTSKQGLHGVPLSKKEFQFLMDRYMKNGKPTSEWPKNAEEVKELKKKIKAEISGT